MTHPTSQEQGAWGAMLGLASPLGIEYADPTTWSKARGNCSDASRAAGTIRRLAPRLPGEAEPVAAGV